MSFIATIEKAGVIPVQDFSFRTGRRKNKLAVGDRAVRYGVRIIDQEDDNGQLGRWVVDKDVIGDFLDGVGWPAADPQTKEAGQLDRDHGAWMGAWPAVLTEVPSSPNPRATSSPGQSSTEYKARPMFEHPSLGLKDDTRFKEIVVIPAVRGLRKGTRGSVFNLTHEDKQIVVFLPSGGQPLVAHWRNFPNDESSIVYDIDTNGDIDKVINARIDTTWKIREWVEPCQKAPQFVGTGKTGIFQKSPSLKSTADYAVAINGKRSPEGPGYFFTTFDGMDALFSYLMNGPLRPATLKHKLADRPTDGPLVAGAIDTNAYWTQGNEPYDGPLRFIEKPYPDVNDGVHPYEVFRHMEFRDEHGFRCKNKPGVWKEFVRLPVTETPPCTPTKNYDTITTDASTSAQRIYDHQSNLIYMGKIQANGEVWQPRSNVLAGPPTPSAAVRSRIQKENKSVALAVRSI